MDYNNNMNMNEERELGWDDEITAEAQEFIILPEGEYDFIIKKPVERGRKQATDKMPACNKATVTITVMHEGREVNIPTVLLLHSRTEWKLSQFFECIGLKKKGEPLRMQWNAIVGTKGRAKINTREYNGNKYNNVQEFVIKSNSQGQNWQNQSWG